MKPELREIVSDLKVFVEYLKGMGLEDLSLPERKEPSPEEKRVSPVSKSPGVSPLEEVRQALGDCQRCRLHQTRRTLVFGEGSEKAQLMVIGEGPGHEEDVQGRPFVGRAGQLLTKILQSIQLNREDVYIANIIKCRPPQNRNPQPDEIEHCYPFLLRQIEAIRPQIICALGTFAAQTLLKTEAKITALRGRTYDLTGIKVFPTYHPAFLLRNPERKRDVWEDMKKISAALRSEVKRI